MSELGQRDYVIAIDRSGSMGEAHRKGNSQTRWQYAQESVMSLARKCAESDPDGIDVYLFNQGFKKYENTTPDKVADLFKSEQPMGGTNFVPFLNDALENHFKNQKRPTTIFVLTDGEPSDSAKGQKELEQLIIKSANRIEGDNELAISFIQVGEDPAASKFLKRLDDELQKAGAKFDIVDAKTADEVSNMTPDQVLAAAVND